MPAAGRVRMSLDRRLAGALLIPLVLVLDASDASAALRQAWPPFVLVAGLLLIGRVAGHDGLFDAVASRLVRLPGPPLVLLLACFALVAVVTALLNLDTSAVFLTPVLIKTAQRRRLETTAFLYGSVFMANACSLFLPGSNLTNLLVLSDAPTSGGAFFARMLPMALAAAGLTAAGLVLIHRDGLLTGAGSVSEPPTRLRLGAGLLATLLAAVLIVVMSNAALAVLLLGLVLLAWRAGRGELGWRESLSWLGAPILVSLFALAVAVGTLARASAFPADVLHSAGSLSTAVIAALASVALNNLPAAALLSATRPVHVGALLLGLDVGPNLALSGSLAVLLWWRAASAVGIRPSALAYSRQGLLLAPMAMLGALAIGGAF
jgi:arsenical pump membrane protein